MHAQHSSDQRPMNRAERRNRKKGVATAPSAGAAGAAGAGAGRGKVPGTGFAGPAPRQFQNRRSG